MPFHVHECTLTSPISITQTMSRSGVKPYFSCALCVGSLPVQANIQNVKDAIRSAVDVMQAMASSVGSLLPKVVLLLLKSSSLFVGVAINVILGGHNSYLAI